jgi:protein TonB
MPNSYSKPMPQQPSASALDAERRQRNRMLLAVFLLLFAVGVVLVKDWGTLLPSADETSVSQAPEEVRQQAAQEADPAEAPRTEPASPAALPANRAHRPRHASPQPKLASVPPPENGIVVSNRAVLPPLRVEVVAGNHHRAVHPGSASTRVDMDTPEEDDSGPAQSSPAGEVDRAATSVSAASDRVQMSTGAALEVERPVQPEYPVLARQMKVQGSVVLEAMISKDGGIQDLQVVRGPAILADAARQAVRQWRFKPYLQNGQPVETQANITVNFTISTN